jgi:hypothetical protein
VKQDYVQVYKWYDLAARGFANVKPDAQDTAAKQRDFVATKMTTAQITGALRLAHELTLR